MVLCAAEPKKDMLLIRRNVKWLEATSDQGRPAQRLLVLSRAPAATTATRSSPSSPSTTPSASASKSAAKPGSSPPNYWRNTQNDDGSWGYVPGDAGTGSMTCAGIGGLAVSSAALESGDATVENGRVVCCRPHEVDDKLDRAIDWLANDFSVTHNPRPAGGGQSCLYYYLYGLERAGRLTARRFIGDHDWYREGAEFLVREQDSLSHYWKGNWYAEHKPRISTADGAVVLVERPPPDRHGQGEVRRRRRLEPASPRRRPSHRVHRRSLGPRPHLASDGPGKGHVEDLLQAPVLYISGSQAPDLMPHAKKLRDYVDRGGFIFAEACCSDSSALR